MKQAVLPLRRLLLLATVLGTAVACGLNMWFRAVAEPGTINDYLWLAWLHEPAIRVAEFMLRYLKTNDPWKVRLATLCAWAVLIGMWTLASLTVILLIRGTIGLFSRIAGPRKRRALASLLVGVAVASLQWGLIFGVDSLQWQVSTPCLAVTLSAIPGMYVAIIASGNPHGGLPSVIFAGNLIIYGLITYGLIFLWNRCRFVLRKHAQ